MINVISETRSDTSILEGRGKTTYIPKTSIQVTTLTQPGFRPWTMDGIVMRLLVPRIRRRKMVSARLLLRERDNDREGGTHVGTCGTACRAGGGRVQRADWFESRERVWKALERGILTGRLGFWVRRRR